MMDNQKIRAKELLSERGLPKSLADVLKYSDEKSLIAAIDVIEHTRGFKDSSESLLTNNDFGWTGAHTIKVYKVTTATMNDYDRAGTGGNNSRYGQIQGLDATTEEMTLTKDRSFTFAIDKLDTDETKQQLQGASALARQQREVVIPEVDSYTYSVMCTKAGHKPDALTLTKDNIYLEIIKGNAALDNAEVPETGRIITVTPDVYLLMKQCKDITMETDIGNDMRIRGVIANLDGASVIKVPASRLPENFGFMIAHPCATVAPTKLEDYKIHQDPPGISGSLVEGRICYDAFVLDNKANAIYYQQKQQEIIKKIQSLCNADYMQVLFKVYVQDKTIKQASQEMGRSYNFVLEAHKKALAEFDKKYYSFLHGKKAESTI